MLTCSPKGVDSEAIRAPGCVLSTSGLSTIALTREELAVVSSLAAHGGEIGGPFK